MSDIPMKKIVYDVTKDKQGNSLFLHLADCSTWHETLQYRRLQKYQRTLPSKISITTVVYDERGNFLRSP